MSPQLPVFLFILIASGAASNHTKDITEEPVEYKHDNNSTKEILKASETADPTKVEIVKQIRRLNEDGSYTIGYEADDGTFKIESRDVLGNVKGTFGYVDRDGEIKRVTYSSSSDSTPVPVTTSTSPTTTTTLKINKTVSSTTRRPQLSTVVYPTRGTVIQPIPRRRPSITSSTKQTTTSETTTEKQKVEETTTNILNLYKTKKEDSAIKNIRSQVLKSISSLPKDDLATKSSSVTSTKSPHTVRPVYEHVNEKEPEKVINKANIIRREPSGTSNINPHMISLQQSAGDDSTDVYGGHLSSGTVRPLFTTTTPRAKLVPIHSLVAARHKIQQQYQDINLPEEEQETTIEASTGRVFDHESVVTSNPVPVIQIPSYRDQTDGRIYSQHIYRRPATVQFRTREYLRDNPDSPIPIGNQRPFLSYEYQNQPKVLEPQFVKEHSPSQHAKAAMPEVATIAPYDIRPVTRIIPIAVDEHGVPIPGYQARFVNPYRQPTQQAPPPVIVQPRVEPLFDDMNSISTPVSTRDLKRLLQILIFRQNRLQTLMDQIMSPGPPYQPLHLFRQAESQQYHNDYRQRPTVTYETQNTMLSRQYPQEEDRYDYRYDQQYRKQNQQQELYSNQISNFENHHYDSQRYTPRRRLYTRPYDTASASTSHIEEGNQEYLPAEVREALLLKMLMLAISPDYMPTPAPATELTTATPVRKQVRNIQILGEEGSMDEMKRKMQTPRHS